MTLDDVLITAELSRRPAREPNWRVESEALRSLTRQLVHDPEVMLQSLVDWAVELCGDKPATAGVSLVEFTPEGHEICRWVALAGDLAHQVGSSQPREFSPYGICFDQGMPVLFSHPERYFTYLQAFNVPFVEGLVLPLIAEEQPLGAIWIVSHDEGRQFDAEDVRLMTGLADFAAATLLRNQQHTQTLLTANARLEKEVAERKRTEAAIAADLQDTQRLHNLATRLITEGDIETLYQEIMAAAIALTHAVAGSIQILDEATQELVLIAIQGPTPEMAQHFQRVDARSQTSCGRALVTGERTFVDFDVPESEDLDGSMRMHVEAGYLSAQSTPLITRSGKPIGMVSTHWGTHHRPTDRELRFLDLLARQAADLIEQRQAEAALRESEQRLSAIFAQAAVGLSEISLEGYFEQVNDALCHMLGRSRAALLAATIPAVTHPEDVSKSLAALGQLLETGEPVSLDKRYVRSDGTFVWANSILTRLDDEQGQPRRILAVTIDLSDRQQAETDRIRLSKEQAARLEAEQANRMKDEFLSMVSHELQSPLVAILGWTRLLRAHPPTRAQLAHQLEIIERNATLQAKLIQDMLDISRILVNKLNLTLQPIELELVIENAIATLYPKADEKGIEIDFRLPLFDFGLGATADHPKSKIQNPKLVILGDSERLHQVFVNILTNAVKFTPAFGQIMVIGSLIEVDNHLYAEVSITDTGIGIAADFLPYVFDRFLQAEKSGSAGGLGLGLAIARHLVELHQGTIQVESPGLGQGTTFTVRLPLIAED